MQLKLRYVIGIFVLGVLLAGLFVAKTNAQLGAGGGTISQLSHWLASSGYIKTASTTAKLWVPGLASSDDCVVTDATGKFSTAACGTGGGVSGGTANMLTAWVDSTTLTATSTPTAARYIATSTTASSFPYASSTAVSATRFWGPLTGNVTGTASLATALAANGSNCSAGSFPLGVDAGGAVETCTDAWTEAENTSAAYQTAANVYSIVGSTTTLPNLSITESQISNLVHWATTSTNYWAQNALQLGQLSDVSTTSLATYDVLYWTGTEWARTATSSWDTNTTYTAGDALTLTGTDIDFDGGTAPGGELGGTWASPTIDDSVAVSSWNLTTPTFTTNFTFDGVTVTGLTGADVSVVTGTAGATDDCAKWDANGDLVSAGAACGSGGGGSISGWATTTSSVSGQLNLYPTLTTDILNVGGSATTSSEFWVDPNTVTAQLNGSNGTSSMVMGSSNNQWVLGTSDTDKSFRIASSTWLLDGAIAALTISKAGVLTYTYGSTTAISATNFWGALKGNADTATALVANGGNCSAGNAPLGVDTLGAVESCFDVWTEAENTAAAYLNTAGVNAYIHASTTIPKTYTANTFTGLQTIGNASTTELSTTNLWLGTVRTGTWNGTSLADAYVDDTITASNYVLTSAFNGLFDTRLGASSSLPQVGSMTGLGNVGSSSATTTFAGYVSSTAFGIVGKFFANASQIWTTMTMVFTNGFTVSGGTADMSAATVKMAHNKNLTIPGTATTTTATTTFPLGQMMVATNLEYTNCRVTSGTGGFQFSDGTNKTTYRAASTTGSRYAVAGSDTWTVDENFFIEYGPMTDAQLTCGVTLIEN